MSALSGLEYLESLDNKELRKKCLEYNLPNVPITDTSRKIIIRRLHEAIEPNAAAAKAKNKKNNRQRQSMPNNITNNNSNNNKSKYNSASDSSASEDNIKENKLNNNRNARRTIAGQTIKQNVEIEQKSNENEMPPPIRPAPKAAKKLSPQQLKQISSQPQTLNIIHESEQQHNQQQQKQLPLNYNYNINQMSSHATQQIPEISPNQNTIGNYTTDTTPFINATYKEITTTIPTDFLSSTQSDEIEGATTGFFGDYNQQYNNYNYNNDKTFNNNNRHVTTTTTIDQFDQMPISNTSIQQQQQQQLNSTRPARLERLASLSNSGVLTTSYTQDKTPSVQFNDTDEYDEMDIDDASEEFEASEDASEGDYEFEDDADDDDVDDEIETIGKHYFPTVSTTAPNNNNNKNNYTNTNKLYPNLNGFTNDNINMNAVGNVNTSLSFTPTQFTKYKPKRRTTTKNNLPRHNDNDDDEEVYDELETPFLSEFTRKLETLKSSKLTPPPIPKNVISKRNLKVGYVDKIETTKPINYKGYYERPMARPPLDTNKSALKRNFEMLDQKYQIKKYLAAIILFVSVVFIYVLFFE